jgi:signal peptidase II
MMVSSPTMINRKNQLVFQFAWIGFLILCWDQISKFLVFHYVPLVDSSAYWYPYGGIEVFRNLAGIEFSINYMTNKGAAWGMFGNYQLSLMLFRVGLIAGLCVYLFKYNEQKSWQIPLIMVIAGAIGNVLDFFFYGHVVDMFHFVLWGYDFPVFNLADSAISIGIGCLFILSLFKSN